MMTNKETDKTGRIDQKRQEYSPRSLGHHSSFTTITTPDRHHHHHHHYRTCLSSHSPVLLEFPSKQEAYHSLKQTTSSKIAAFILLWAKVMPNGWIFLYMSTVFFSLERRKERHGDEETYPGTRGPGPGVVIKLLRETIQSRRQQTCFRDFRMQFLREEKTESC